MNVIVAKEREEVEKNDGVVSRRLGSGYEEFKQKRRNEGKVVARASHMALLLFVCNNTASCVPCRPICTSALNYLPGRPYVRQAITVVVLRIS